MSPYNCFICHVNGQGFLKNNLINVAIGLHKGMNGITLKDLNLCLKDVLHGLILTKVGFMS